MQFTWQNITPEIRQYKLTNPNGVVSWIDYFISFVLLLILIFNLRSILFWIVISAVFLFGIQYKTRQVKEGVLPELFCPYIVV